MKRVYVIVLGFIMWEGIGTAYAKPAQPLEALPVTEERLATAEVLTDQPNFRGLPWYPAKDRYQDPEKEGQRALVFPSGWKNELLRVNSCYFTELYVAIEADHCDVSFITDNIITFGTGGNAVAQTGNSRGNYYRPVHPEESAPFDQLVP